jgi:hypothetical protein
VPPGYAPLSDLSERTSRKIVVVSGLAALDVVCVRGKRLVDASPGWEDGNLNQSLTRCRGVDGRETVAESSREGCIDAEFLGINGEHRNRLALSVGNVRRGLLSRAFWSQRWLGSLPAGGVCHVHV